MPVERAATTAEIWPVIAPYLSFRAETFPAETAGASQAVEGSAEILFDAWPDDRVAALQRCVRPVQIDGRMHRWEWIAGRSGVLKTDAVDHARAHDLVGCQDIAWDVAGAIVEFGVSDAQGEQLVRAVLGDRTEMTDLTALLTLCYLGFQIGWWDFAAELDSAARQSRFYANQVEVLVRRSI
jgi:hypothetical protein